MRLPKVLDWDNKELWREMFIHEGVCEIPEGVEIIGNAKGTIEGGGLWARPNGVFCGCGVEELYLPSTLRYLGTGAFCDNYIDELYIPEGVVEINDWALEYTRSRYIEISDTVRKIGSYSMDFTCADTVIFGRGLEVANEESGGLKEGADLYVYANTEAMRWVDDLIACDINKPNVNVIVLD